MRAQIQLGDHVDNEPSQMIRRQGLPQTDGLFESRFVINGLEFSGHATSVSQSGLSQSDDSPTGC